MITELEQCSCGIVFPTPMVRCNGYASHLANGRHNRALSVGTCGPCYFTACSGCENRRSGQGWKCNCNHELHNTSVDRSDETVYSMALLWSTWLAAGCPSERDMK